METQIMDDLIKKQTEVVTNFGKQIGDSDKIRCAVGICHQALEMLVAIRWNLKTVPSIINPQLRMDDKEISV